MRHAYIGIDNCFPFQFEFSSITAIHTNMHEFSAWKKKLSRWVHSPLKRKTWFLSNSNKSWLTPKWFAFKKTFKFPRQRKDQVTNTTNKSKYIERRGASSRSFLKQNAGFVCGRLNKTLAGQLTKKYPFPTRVETPGGSFSQIGIKGKLPLNQSACRLYCWRFS